jgi:DNA polymerase III subunit delta
MHATAFLKNPKKHAGDSPVVVLVGKVRYLKQAALRALTQIVLGDDDDDMAVTRFAGKDAELKSVCDELLTVSMWGDRRMVLVEDAGDFVTKNRAGLEKYVAKPSKKSVLVLDVETWPKNTRLAKAVDQVGLAVECSELSGAALGKWIEDVAKDQHGKQIPRNAVQQLVQLAGTELGLLEQELSKLAAYVGDRPKIEADDVVKLVGGWKAETTWAMIGAVRDGQVGAALAYLDKLLVAGEAPQKLLGGINFSFRKLATATELARQGRPLHTALREAGVFPNEIGAATAYLRRIGRPRAEKLLQWLLEIDGDLKGNSRLPDRVQLECLLVRLSGV